MEYKSRYNVIETRHGFIVSGEDRATVDVVFEPTRISVNGTYFGFYSYRAMVKMIAAITMKDWHPRMNVHDGVNYEPYWVRKWAENKTCAALGKRIHEQWLRLLKGIDPLVLAVHRSVFAATLGDCHIAMSPELYTGDLFVARDIAKYRAAAIAAKYIGSLTYSQFDDGEPDYFDYSDSDIIRKLHNWRGLFSISKVPYRSLNRTLDNLCVGISAKLVCNLTEIRLRRPLTNRMELLLNLLFAERGDSLNWHVIHYASSDHIKAALRLLSEHTQNALQTRRTRSVTFLLSFIADYPGEHSGNLVGLVRKSIDWHVYARAESAAKISSLLGANKPCALPPISLPSSQNITFLRTVGDICNEGASMQHCISSYVAGAVAGDYYLFSVLHGGERATVQVLKNGKVAQSSGPRNKMNNAAKYGSRALAKWGTGLRHTAELCSGEVQF